MGSPTDDRQPDAAPLAPTPSPSPPHAGHTEHHFQAAGASGVSGASGAFSASHHSHPPSFPYWSRTAGELFDTLASRLEGLTTQEAEVRLRRLGPNAVDEHANGKVLSLLWRQTSSPLVLILVFGAIVSIGLGDWTDAGIILAIVTGSILLGFSQEYRASNAVAKLRQQLAITARVLRNGRLRTLPVASIVPGDIVRLSAGNLVPADGVILEATDFLVSEASLTGEPFPVEKRPGVVAADSPPGARSNCVFAGTSVRSGTASVLIAETGRRTAFGAIAASLKENPPETDFNRGVRHFGYLLVRIMLFTIIFVLGMNQFLDRPLMESLLFAVALAVGLSPELLPAIVSVTLSHGARAMAACGVIVRHPEAIENLGSMDVLCTDKTGTLTEGVISLNDAVDPAGVTSAGVRRLAFLNAALETGIDNPLDAALVDMGTREGMTADGVRKIDEIPYDFIRKRLTIVVELQDASEHHIITKGAFASVIGICSHVRSDEQEQPLDDGWRARLDAYYQQQGRQGMRVLAVASRRSEPRADYGHDDESAMCFEGFLLFFDPVRRGVRENVAELAALGIKVKIITGDNRHVAAHVAAELGLAHENVLTGAEIAGLNDESLWYRATETDLFAEVDPQQKERIVRALQHGRHVVGYIGDGINDAPPLHAADVGISVSNAVDVARDTADIVLLRPGLDVLREGVVQGRMTFANTLKYICVTTSANFGNMMSMALATSFLPFLPLSAKQILLNNFLSDIPSIAISTDKVDAERLRQSQEWDMREVRRFMIVFGLISSAFDILTFLVLRMVFDASETVFQTSWFLVSLLTELAVVLVLRTTRPAWRSMPGLLLLTATVLVGVAALAIPYIPGVAGAFGLTPLPPPIMASAIAIVIAYILTTEAVKSRFYSRTRRRV
ncbi:magnesium-translocating P-type ATPase [Noviherbaspirillum agri]